MAQPSGPVREPLSFESRLTIYRAHVLDGVAEADLPTQFNALPEQVRHAIASVESSLALDCRSQLDEMRVRQTQRLEAIYCEAMAAFQRSRQDVTTKRVVEGETKSAENGNPTSRKPTVGAPKVKLETSTAGQAGDAKFLSVARDALADIRSVWGLESSSGGSSGEAPEPADAAMNVQSLSDSELKPLREANRIVERLRSSRPGGGIERNE